MCVRAVWVMTETDDDNAKLRSWVALFSCERDDVFDAGVSEV